MNYKKILETLSKNVNFSKYDAFSTDKKCHYITYDGVEYALLWQTVKEDKMKQYLDDLFELQKRIFEAKRSGAILPAILAVHRDKNHVFQLQEKVPGKKLGYIELLDQKTTVEDFIDILVTFDLMNLNGLTVNYGHNCNVDDEGHLYLFDCNLAKVDKKQNYNTRPELFKKVVFPEPNITDEEIPAIKPVLERILTKWITACAKYFSSYEEEPEIIYDEIDLTIRNYSFLSLEEKKTMINDILGKTLQIKK